MEVSFRFVCFWFIYFLRDKKEFHFMQREHDDDEEEEAIESMERKGTPGGRIHFGKEVLSTFAPSTEKER